MYPFYASASALALLPVGWGYVAIAVLTIAYATMYIPTKKYDTGNGKHLFLLTTTDDYLFL